ncbi:MAG: hypothetical protein ACR2RD_10510 [Woeseiaceae bacterium]
MLDELQNIGPRERRLALLGIGLVATAIAVSLALLPGVKTYLSAAKAVAVLEDANDNAEDLDQQLEERYANIEELKFRLHGDMANLPLKQVESYVIGKLQKISWRNDVDLVSVEPAAGQQVQTFNEVLFNIELIGEYDNIYRWLWDAKNELGFVVVKEYGMRRRGDDDDNPRLLTTVSLASYRAQQ